jgi:hypothetical protein
MQRRALTALTVMLAGAAALLFGFALAGPGDRAGAQPGATTTTACSIFCHSTTVPAPATTPPPPTTVPATTAPPATTPRTQPPQTRSPATTPRATLPAPTTTATTLPSIVNGNLPVTPSTVPFTTEQQSSHVSPVFAALSGAGLFVALVIVGVRFITSRPPP